MQVMKFGGTSVADASAISTVTDIVSAALERDRTIVVCSAVGGCTDRLIETGRKAARRDESYLEDITALKERHFTIIEKLLPKRHHDAVRETVDGLFRSLEGITRGVFLLGELSDTSLDAIQSYGELFSTKIIAAKFSSLGIPAVWLDSREIVRTVKGAVDTETTYANVRKAVDACPHTPLFIVPGFIATDALGRITTLGRGGSDYTASLYAVGINARLVEIWTDVDGMMTANPKVVPTARTIRNISYRAAQELSHFGAKVIYPPTIQPVVEEGIPIYVRNTFHPDGPSTLVEKNPPRVGSGLIGISNSDNIALISLEGSGMVGIPGFSSRLFDALTRSGVNIILITQASSVHTMCIAIAEKDAEKARAASDECFAYEISLGKLNPLKVETGFSIVCLVGDDILGQVGITGRMLAALGSHGIPVRATAQGSSERNISVILPSDRVGDAIRHIHESFFDNTSLRNINLFIAGYGKVGKELVRIIQEGNERIASRTGKRLRICGLSNSRKFLLNPEGLADFDLANGWDAASDAYIDALTEISLKNSIFVDCTASEDIVFRYPGLFKAGYSIVSCNKNPFAGPYETYKSLKEGALHGGKALRYETTAGAALPIVGTIQGLLDAGDTVRSVEAVLSGTLAYLMDRYTGTGFDELVEEARLKGYTEPDPSTDLSGRDVLRKVLILAREAGWPLEEKEILLEAVPSSEEMALRYTEAASNGLKLRYIASITPDSATVGLRAVGEDSPFYSLRSTDNLVRIISDAYPSGITVSGSGAGPFQTAGGLLHDILTIK